MSTQKQTSILTKSMINRLFKEKYCRQKRPILHKLFTQCPEFVDLNKVSKSTARKVFCEFFDVEIELVQFHLMQKPMTKVQLSKHNFSIAPMVIEELVTNHLK